MTRSRKEERCLFLLRGNSGAEHYWFTRIPKLFVFTATFWKGGGIRCGPAAASKRVWAAWAPVVVMARCLDMTCYLEAMQLGAADYLAEPVTFSEMERVLRNHRPTLGAVV